LAIRSFLKNEVPADAIIIEGEARGADKMARQEAEKLGMTVERYPANWEVTDDTPPHRIRQRKDGTLYDVAAGPIRNTQMLKEGKPDRVVAFHSNIKRSKGTADMIRQAKAAGIPTEVRE
jgi:hypothetical protein